MKNFRCATFSAYKGKTDWARLRAMTEKEIERNARQDPDSLLLEDCDMSTLKVFVPPQKRLVSLRVDSDVLEWFRKKGKGYQTRINAVLRAYVNAQK
jgi:uncharacterized protein (DUF4415 family)